MRNIIIILLICVLIGILWLGTGVLTFSEDKYVNSDLEEKARLSGEYLDTEFLKRELKPAYEF